MKKKAKNTQPDWHADFRISENLPDIKAIRTDFIVNGIAVGLVLFLAFLVGQRELQSLTVAEELRDLEARIEETQASNRQSLALNQRFAKAMAQIEDLNHLYMTPVVIHDLLASLAERKPENLRLDRLQISRDIVTEEKKTELRYRIVLTGVVEEPETLNAYKQIVDELLEQSTEYAPVGSSSAQETMGGRDEFGHFPFTIEARMGPVKAN